MGGGGSAPLSAQNVFIFMQFSGGNCQRRPPPGNPGSATANCSKIPSNPLYFVGCNFDVVGHAIECGWFLLRLAERNSDEDLAAKAIKYFIERPFEYGWDQTHGGIYSFLDVGK